MMRRDNGSFVNTTSTSSLHSLLEKGMTTSNGTINVQQTIFNAIHSKVITSLIQAITTAERTVGNNSFAVAGLAVNMEDILHIRLYLVRPQWNSILFQLTQEMDMFWQHKKYLLLNWKRCIKNIQLRQCRVEVIVVWASHF